MTHKNNSIQDPASKPKTAMFKPRKTIYETNFDRLKKLGVIDENNQVIENSKSTSGGIMDLYIEAVPHLDRFTGNNTKAYSLAHYFLQNGDLCQDPEIVFFYSERFKSVEVYSFQQALPPCYDVVYPEPNQVRPVLKKSLNSFFRQWLTNLINQDHGSNWTKNN